jgi:LysM repeat protein
MPTACPPPADWALITIQAGDDLPGLALLHRTTTDELKRANCLLIDTLVIGATFYVPAAIEPTEPIAQCQPYPGWVYYTVQPGDTLYQISLMFGTSVSELKFANCLASDLINVGQRLYVPNRPVIRTPVPIIPTFTALPSFTPPPANTATATNTATSTSTPEPIPDTPTPTSSPTPTNTPTPAPSATVTPLPSPTPTPTAPPPSATPTVPTTTPADTPTNTTIP